MRIALVVERYSKAGGQERAFVAFAESLCQRHELTLLTAAVEWAPPREVTIRQVRLPRGPELLRFVSFVRATERAFKAEPHSLIHGIGANCPVADVVHLQTVNREKYTLLGPEPTRDPLRRLARRAYIKAVERAEARALKRRGPFYVAVSRRVGEEAQRWYGVDPDDIRRIPNGYDPEDFNPEVVARRRVPTRNELGIGEDEFAILFVGPDDARKGLPTLLEAFSGARLGKCRLIVVGGPETSQRRYRARAQSLGVGNRVSFVPHSPDVAGAYAAADLFVLPTRYDPFGMVVIEAMACGVPVVVSSCAGVVEYLTEDDAVVLERPTDTLELRSVLESLRSGRQRLTRLARSGREAARSFTWSRIVPQLDAVYEEAHDRRFTPPT